MIFSSRSGKTLLPVLLVILVIGAGISIWYWTRPATQPSAAAGRSVAEAFLGELQAGQPAQAWDATTAEFKSAQGKESFVASVKKDEFLKQPLDFVSSQTVAVGEHPRTELVYRSKTGPTVRIVIGREGNAWKVDRWTK
jgi:hypothetical protein